MRCIACNSLITNNSKRKKPVTLYIGHMNSIYTDVVEDFPRNEHEDLCTQCIRSVNGISSDLSEFVDVDAGGFWRSTGIAPDIEPEVMDSAFEYTTKVYEGFKD